MKTKIILIAMLLPLIIGISCKKQTKLRETTYDCQCSGYEIIPIRELKNEPAIIKYSKIAEAYTIELIDKNSMKGYLYIPCENNLPEKFKIENLSVRINGKVFDCKSPPLPHVRLYARYFVEISSIKKIL